MTLNNYFSVPINNTGKNRPKPKLWLMKPDFTKIERLDGITSLNGTFKFTNVNQISFKLSPFIYDEAKHEQVKNPLYDIIRNKYIIHYEYNGFKDYLVVDDIKKISNESDSIDVVADSLCDELNKKPVAEVEYVATPLLDIMSDVLSVYAPLWTVSYVDPKVTSLKRELESQQTTVMAVIDQVNTLFDTVVIFNNLNRTMAFHHKDNVGNNRGLRIRENSYLKSFEDSMVSKDIVTRLYPFGKEGLTINEVNPAGTDYIEDFSYFIKPFQRDARRNVLRHSDYMSDELCHALLDYTEFYNSQKHLAQSFIDSYKSLLETYADREQEVYEYENIVQRQRDRIELLKPKNEWIDYGTKYGSFRIDLEKSSYYMVVIKNTGSLANVYINDTQTTINPNDYALIKVDARDFADALEPSEATYFDVSVVAANPSLRVILTRSSLYDYESDFYDELDEKYNSLKYEELLANAKSTLSSVESRLESIIQSKNALANSMHPRKFLGEKLYKEREQFVYGAVWQEENHTEAQALFDDASKQLGKQNNATRAVTINVVNFVQSLENQEDWDKLNASDTIVFSNKMFDEKLKAYITDINIDFEQNTVNLTVSDVFDYKDLNTKLSEKLATVSSSASTIRFTADQLKLQTGKITQMSKMIQGEWDANKRRVLAGNETVDIGSHGIKVISNDNPNEWLIAVGGVLAMTKDNGETFRTGITPDGINAETVIGRFVLGENLWFENESGTFRFDKDGLNIDVNNFNLTTGAGAGKKSYFDVLKNEIEETALEREKRLRKEYLEALDRTKKEALDVERIVSETSTTIAEAFKDGVITDVEKKLIENSLATLQKENQEYITKIEEARNNMFVSEEDLIKLNDLENKYKGMYDTLVTSINLSISDGIATSEETAQVNKAITEFKEEIQDILTVTSEIMNRTLNKQIKTTVEESLDYVVTLNKDLQDELDDFNKSLNEVKVSVDGSIEDNIISDSEKEAINTAFKILNSEFDDITNRFEIMKNNPKLDQPNRDTLIAKYTEYANKMTEFEASVTNMITDGLATEEEKANYNTKFNELSVAKIAYSEAYADGLLNISLKYSSDAKGEMQRTFDALKSEIDGDLRDVDIRIGNLEKDLTGSLQDGVVTETEKARLKTHLDMLDRESADLELNYQTLIKYNTVFSSTTINYLGDWRAYYTTYFNALKNTINTVISDGTVTPLENASVTTDLTNYKNAFAGYRTALMESSATATKSVKDTFEDQNDKIINVFQNLASGLQVGTTQSGKKSLITFDPNSITLDSKKITLGYDGSSDVSITNGITRIKNLSADRISSGKINTDNITIGNGDNTLKMVGNTITASNGWQSATFSPSGVTVNGGGLHVGRSDGGRTIKNSKLFHEVSISSPFPPAMSLKPGTTATEAFSIEGEWLAISQETSALFGSGYANVNKYVFKHTARYLLVSVTADVSYNGCHIRIFFPNGNSYSGNAYKGIVQQSQEPYIFWHQFKIDLGTPTNSNIHFYVQAKTNNQGTGKFKFKIDTMSVDDLVNEE